MSSCLPDDNTHISFLTWSQRCWHATTDRKYFMSFRWIFRIECWEIQHESQFRNLKRSSCMCHLWSHGVDNISTCLPVSLPYILSFLPSLRRRLHPGALWLNSQEDSKARLLHTMLLDRKRWDWWESLNSVKTCRMTKRRKTNTETLKVTATRHKMNTQRCKITAKDHQETQTTTNRQKMTANMQNKGEET